MKKCCMCQKDLPLSAFKSNKNRSDGLQSQCAECQREYRRKHYLKNKAKYIAKAACWRAEFMEWWKEYKSHFSCERCGEKHQSCIQFHHPNDDKEGSVSDFVNNCCKDSVLAEIKKCIVLCANCHFKEHWKD